MRWPWQSKPPAVVDAKWKKIPAHQVKPGDVVHVFDTFVRTVLRVHVGTQGPGDPNGAGRRPINFEFPNDPDWWHIDSVDYLVSVRE